MTLQYFQNTVTLNATMRLLLVEDDRDLSEFVQEGLQREGFSVDVARDGQQAVDMAEDSVYDVVLLDVMMPNLDGIAVLKTLRKRGFKGGILLATCKGQEKDKLLGLNSGADDYIVKPFLLTELVARVRAVLRRTSATGEHHQEQATVLEAGELTMDLLRREVKRGQKLLMLTKKEFDLLEYFLRRPGQVLSQQVLSQHLSNTDFNTTNVVEVHVKNLRSKIDPKSGPSLIRTVRGCGYALDV